MVFSGVSSRWQRSALVLLGLAASGCFSLQHGEIRTSGMEHVHVSNFGWRLFNFIPIACGNASRTAWTPWVFFRDDVTMDKVQERFMTYAESHTSDVTELTYTTNESVMLNIPGLNVPLPIPYLLTYREIQLSGLLTKRDATKVATEARP